MKLTAEMVKKAARGFGADLCGIASMDHLQKTGALSRKFVNPFRKRPPWALSPPWEDEDWDDQPGPGVPVDEA